MVGIWPFGSPRYVHEWAFGKEIFYNYQDLVKNIECF